MMKKWIAVLLTVLLLLSCVNVVSADSPRRVTVTACDTVEGWGNNDAPYLESNIPGPILNPVPDSTPVVTYTYGGPVAKNGGWQREDEAGTQGLKISYQHEEPLDLTGMNYLVFELYVSDAQALKDVVFSLELTSSAHPDREERSWGGTLARLKGSELVNGWNGFGMPIGVLYSAVNGDLNLTAWNYMRIYNQSAFEAGDGLRIAFRNMYFCETNPYEEQRREATRLAAEAIIELFAPLREIESAEDITKESYETIKAQLEAALEAYGDAAPEVKDDIFKTLDVLDVEKNVTQALIKFEDAPPSSEVIVTPAGDADTEDELQHPSQDEEQSPSLDTEKADTPAGGSTAEPAQEVIVISPLAVIAGAVVLVAAALGAIALVAKKQKR